MEVVRRKKIERVRRPGVAIVDTGVPGVDGYEVARSMRQRSELYSVALIALSGYARASDVEHPPCSPVPQP